MSIAAKELALPPRQPGRLPYLRSRGAPESGIDAMLVADPARILAG